MALEVVLAAAGSIIGGVNGILGNFGLEHKAYLSRLEKEKNPSIQDWFAKNTTDYTARNNNIIIVLVIFICLILIVLALNGKK